MPVATGHVNQHLAALFSLYDYHARNGVPLAQALVSWRRSNRGVLRLWSGTVRTPTLRTLVLPSPRGTSATTRAGWSPSVQWSIAS